MTTDRLIDRLGARLAFERSSVLLYDALIEKRETDSSNSRPSVAELKHIRSEEISHTQLLVDCIREFGGNPARITHSADIEIEMASGIIQAIMDPRTSVQECLDAILAAELIDNDGCNLLIDLLQGSGRSDKAVDFSRALREEQE